MLLLVLAASLVAGPLTALAQEPTIPLPEVVVPGLLEQGYVVRQATTATKTDSPLIETPQSVSVITRDRLNDQAVNTLAEALRYSAGVQGEPFGFDPRFTTIQIRGFDASDTGLYRDGLQIRNPAFAVSFSLEPWGVERIEILKGPASIMYGAGSPGGLVNLVSKLPTNETFGVVELQPGSFDRWQGRFDVGGPLDTAGVFSYRLTGLVRDADTRVDFIQDDRVFIAPAFTFRPSKDTTFTLLGHFQTDETRASQALPAAGTLFSNPNGPIPTNRFTGEPDRDTYSRREAAIGYLVEHNFNEALTVRQRARYYVNRLDHVTIFASGLQADQRTIDRSVLESGGELNGVVVDTHAQGKFATGPVAHTVLLGVDYQHIDVDARQAFGAAPPLDVFDPVYGAPVSRPPVFLHTDTREQQVGVYLQNQMKVFDKLVLVLSGRHDWATSETVDRLAQTSVTQDDRKLTGRAGLLYLFDVGLAPYFSYSESFVPALGVDASGRPFRPETGRQYEIGLKYQPPGWNSFVTLALFDLTRRNVVQMDPATFLQDQTGEIRSRGIELEGVARLGAGLKLIAAYTFLDLEITESVIPGETGHRPTQVPEHMASLWGDYTFQHGPLRGLGFGAGVRYIGSTFGNTTNTLRTPSATLADLGLHYDLKQFRLAVNLQNALDNEYIASCFVRNGDFCTFGERRNATGSISYRW